MKNIEKILLLVVLFVITTIHQSCDQELADELVSDTITEIDDIHNNDDDTHDEGEEVEDFDESYHEAEGGSITAYKIEGADLIKTKDYDVSGDLKEAQEDTDKHQEIWELVKKIIPQRYFPKISEFVIYWGAIEESAGYVVETQDDLSTWKLGIAIDEAYYGGFNADGELAYTIIHEFGHILTLDNTQLDASISETNCQNYYPGEGCAKTNSYINVIQTNFWSDIWDEYLDAQDSEKALNDFYNRYQSYYVTQYAATNPGEDVAEVFATFVTSTTNVTPSTIAEQKIQVMYNRPELVALRDFIRGNINRSKSSSAYLPVAGSWKNATTFGNPKKAHCTHVKKRMGVN